MNGYFKMKKITFIITLIMILSIETNFAQIKYYTATGKDSITYVATDIGLLILKRGLNGELIYHSQINDSNKVYTRALDNDSFLILGTANTADIYSLLNKYAPNYISSLNVSKLVSIRPFGNHFALIRGGFSAGYYDHYIVGVENDSLKILSSINSYSINYTGRTAFSPEVVYPYFFSKGSDSQIVMYRYSETNKEFEFIDTLNIITNEYNFAQMYGSNNKVFIRERKGLSGNYSVFTKEYEIANDTLNFLSRISYNAPMGFTDEIECTDTLVRFNGSYTYLDGQSLIEPNGYLNNHPNLSGIRIYNTTYLYDKMYYSTKIVGATIQSAQFIYTPTYIDDSNPVSTYTLHQNYPNPFNPSTIIRFEIPELSFVQLKVYDLLGNKIETLVNELKSAGNYEVTFNVNHLADGVYFYRIIAGSFIETKKMLFLK